MPRLKYKPTKVKMSNPDYYLSVSKSKLKLFTSMLNYLEKRLKNRRQVCIRLGVSNGIYIKLHDTQYLSMVNGNKILKEYKLEKIREVVEADDCVEAILKLEDT